VLREDNSPAPLLIPEILELLSSCDLVTDEVNYIDVFILQFDSARYWLFSSPRRQDQFCGPPRGLFPLGVKRQGREVKHSPPSSAKVKIDEAIPPLPHISSYHDT
jgi:hypothetical protein